MAFEQVEDEHGRTLLDRPFTPEEAAANDERNLEKLGGRPGNFLQPWVTDTEDEVRATRRTRRS